jgi:hypothetical protein
MHSAWRVSVQSISFRFVVATRPDGIFLNAFAAAIRKRIAIEFDNDIWTVLHLMIAGRLDRRAVGAKFGGHNNLAAFDFPAVLLLPQAGARLSISNGLPFG